MDEGDTRAMCTRLGFGIDEAIALVAEARDIRLNVVGAKTDVVDAWAAFLEGRSNRALSIEWRDELDARAV